MSEHPKLSRRAALGVMARSTARASAVAMIPVTAALGAPHGEDAAIPALDPIFVAIERHRAAWDTHCSTCRDENSLFSKVASSPTKRRSRPYH